MTPTEKQKCIAEQAVYGLKLAYIDAIITAKGYDTADNVVGVLYWNDECMKEIAFERDCTPILRPLSDLTKEITHRGYNDDKPFVPANVLGYDDYGGSFGVIEYAEYGENPKAVVNPLDYIWILGLLHLWHFDTRKLIATGEAIDVNTLDINPYSVK